MKFVMREYQKEAFEKIMDVYEKNPKDMRAVYQAPTGSGKTLSSIKDKSS
jgi:superfamily II DNA or RNA helicase